VQAAFVWLGGALFVASLASFVFVYGIVLGSPGRSMRQQPAWRSP
jgi:hypothetical protein